LRPDERRVVDLRAVERPPRLLLVREDEERELLRLEPPLLDVVLRFDERPEPERVPELDEVERFLRPPPSCLLTVAHAARSAVLEERPRDSYDSSM